MYLSSIDAQPSRSSFIRLPTEVRLMVYKYAWTPTVNPWDYAVFAQREGRPVSDHMKQIHVLTAVCRHMRYEVIAEYFPQAQAHITYTPGRTGSCGRSDMRVIASMCHLKSSPLFTAHLQHVRLNWIPLNTNDGWLAWDYMVDNARTRRYNISTPYVRVRRVGPFATALPTPLYPDRKPIESRFFRQINTLNWLTSLKNLQTLDITFIDAVNYESMWPVNAERIVPFYNPRVWQQMLKLPKLDWINLRLFSGRQDGWESSPERMADREKANGLVKGLLRDSPEKLKVRSKYICVWLFHDFFRAYEKGQG